MKALWDLHFLVISNGKSRLTTSYTIKLINHLRRWLTTDECLKAVTYKYFSYAYYNSAVWLKESLPYIAWERLFTQLYRASRAAVGDWKRMKLRTLIASRDIPIPWAKYSTASIPIKIFNNGKHQWH